MEDTDALDVAGASVSIETVRWDVGRSGSAFGGEGGPAVPRIGSGATRCGDVRSGGSINTGVEADECSSPEMEEKDNGDGCRGRGKIGGEAKLDTAGISNCGLR